MMALLSKGTRKNDLVTKLAEKVFNSWAQFRGKKTKDRDHVIQKSLRKRANTKGWKKISCVFAGKQTATGCLSHYLPSPRRTFPKLE